MLTRDKYKELTEQAARARKLEREHKMKSINQLKYEILMEDCLMLSARLASNPTSAKAVAIARLIGTLRPRLGKQVTENTYIRQIDLFNSWLFDSTIGPIPRTTYKALVAKDFCNLMTLRCPPIEEKSAAVVTIQKKPRKHKKNKLKKKIIPNASADEKERAALIATNLEQFRNPQTSDSSSAAIVSEQKGDFATTDLLPLGNVANANKLNPKNIPLALKAITPNFKLKPAINFETKISQSLILDVSAGLKKEIKRLCKKYKQYGMNENQCELTPAQNEAINNFNAQMAQFLQDEKYYNNKELLTKPTKPQPLSEEIIIKRRLITLHKAVNCVETCPRDTSHKSLVADLLIPLQDSMLSTGLRFKSLQGTVGADRPTPGGWTRLFAVTGQNVVNDLIKQVNEDQRLEQNKVNTLGKRNV